MTEKYLQWVKDTGQSGLTRAQAELAEFLIENAEHVAKMGDGTPIFKSVQNWLKDGKSHTVSDKKDTREGKELK